MEGIINIEVQKGERREIMEQKEEDLLQFFRQNLKEEYSGTMIDIRQ